MKRSFYLFNPGIMERRDNTLKFTPVIVNEDNEEIKQQPRYIPIEDVAELYAFGSLRANSALFNFLGQKGIPVHFFDYYENYTGSFMPRESLLSGKALLAQTSATSIITLSAPQSSSRGMDATPRSDRFVVTHAAEIKLI